MANAHISVLSLRLKLSGGNLQSEVEVPCVSAFLKFDINSIPYATFSIAPGFKGRDPTVISEIHKQSSRLGRQVRVEAYLIVEGDYSEKLKWPNIEMLLFDGYVTSVGVAGSSKTSNINLACTHWLSMLTFTSAYSKYLHPSAPGDLLVKPGFNFEVGQGAAGGAGDLVFAPLNGSTFEKYSKDVRSDLWLKVIKNAMYFMAQNEGVSINMAILGGVEVPGNYINTQSVAALNRMDNRKYIKMKTLSLRTELQRRESKVVTEMSRQFFHTAYGSTLWHKLVNCSRKFMFKVIPTVQTATCAPFTPFLRNTWVDIQPDEFDQYNSVSGTPRLIRGMCGLGQFVSDIDATAGVDIPSIAAKYDLVDFDPIYKDGILLMNRLPPWVSDLMDASDISKFVAGAKINTVPNPKAQNLPVQPLIFDNDRLLAYNYVKSLFLETVFNHRTGSITGKLRFDICPGSNISIAGPIATDPSYNYSRFYASVVGVSITLDATRPSASTELRFSHAITHRERQLEKEGGEKAFAVETHPLYNQEWTGSPLIHLPGLNPDPN